MAPGQKSAPSMAAFLGIKRESWNLGFWEVNPISTWFARKKSHRPFNSLTMRTLQYTRSGSLRTVGSVILNALALFEATERSLRILLAIGQETSIHRKLRFYMSLFIHVYIIWYYMYITYYYMYNVHYTYYIHILDARYMQDIYSSYVYTVYISY